MLLKPIVRDILQNDALTRGLADPEARVLVEWLVDEAERVIGDNACEQETQKKVRRLCRRGRAIGRFVELWCHEGLYGTATQLAAAEHFDWPLPATPGDPFEIMQAILDWEAQHSTNKHKS